MKIPSLLLITSLMLLGCNGAVGPVSIGCGSTQPYATTIGQAAQRLVGSWQLFNLAVGFGSRPAVPNQQVDFRADGTCLITRDGQRSGPFSYTLTLRTAVGSPAEVLHLVVADSTQPYQPFLRLGTSRLFVCDEAINLDYGSAIDLPAYTYRRQ